MIALKDWVRSCSGLLREVKRAETGAVQEVLGVFGAAKGFCVPLQPQRSGGAAHVSIAASTERGMATRMRAVRSGTDAVRRSGHVQREQRVAGGWCGAGKDIQTAGCSLLRRAQERCGDDDGNREQTVFGLAVAGDDAAVSGGESRAVCGVEFVGQELSVCTSSASDTDLPVAGASQQLSLPRRTVRSTSTTMCPPAGSGRWIRTKAICNVR